MTNEKDPNVPSEIRLTPEQAKALRAVLADRLWWDGFLVRARTWGLVWASIFVGLAALASWWPWITHVVQLLIKDVPK